MSKRDGARRTSIQVSFGGVDVTKELTPYLTSLTFTDDEADEADDLQIVVQDRDGLWMEKWLDKAEEEGSEPGAGSFAVGDTVYFTGSRHYGSSSGDKGYGTRPGPGKITAINPGAKHPYHLIHTDGSTNLYGWVDAGDISAGQEAAAEGSGDGAGTYTVTPSIGLNVRKEPGTSRKTGQGSTEEVEKLGALARGTKVAVKCIENGWALIDYNGRPGYVSAQYLQRAGTVDGSGTGEAATGLKIEAAIVRENWNGDGGEDTLNCGIFTLDAVDCEGPPATVTIKATSLTYDAAIRQTEKSRGWESYRLSGIAEEMARKNGMSCLFLSDNDPFYQRVEQYHESDIAFLRQLCNDAGISLKAANQMLVLFDQVHYEARETVRIIQNAKDGGYLRRRAESYIDYHLAVGTADTQYQSCRVSYNDPGTGKSIQGVAKVDGWQEGKSNQQLEITAKVGSVGEAEALAGKYLRRHNKYCRTAEFTFPGDPAFCAGNTVALLGWGSWTGRYIISRAVHRVDGNGYTTTVTLRRVLEGY